MKLKHVTILVLAAISVHAVHANTLTVTNTADSGPGSLRDTLASAVDGDTIDATGISGTILLTTGELLVSKSMTIAGSGPANLAVDGNAISRVFHIGSNAVVNIFGLTITNGFANGSGLESYGGGLYNGNGSVTLSNCSLSGNLAEESGGAIFNQGVSPSSAVLKIFNSTLLRNAANDGGGIANAGILEIAHSHFQGNSALFNYGGGLINTWEATILYSTFDGNNAGSFGGAIFNDRSLRVSNCTIRENSADNGGGLFNSAINGFASLEVLNSTLSGNSATDAGGGIQNTAYPGYTGAVYVTNSTVSGNSAFWGGGLFNTSANGSANLVVINSTLSGNLADAGGGIYNEALSAIGGHGSTVQLGSTIVNSAASAGTITNESGTITSLGYNLSRDDGGGFLTDPTDQINTDPMLGPLRDNGGPTFTHALLCGSPAIDHGFNFARSANDQRGTGFIRTLDDPAVPNALGGDGTDIGAYEVQRICAPLDSDGDGIPDVIDQCPDTAAGDIVDASGCGIDQLVPCDGPQTGGVWRNHGQYVRAVIQIANDFLKAGLINHRQWSQIVTSAAQSRCGWNPYSDHDADQDWHRN
jgi:hypothetical protein